ncbi:zinc-binding dehydrogenase [Panus rudis PR-1116 ss-1]|nr:zinc-binding dehydrogenase [Panus rudis PR-1116 ss-1]
MSTIPKTHKAVGLTSPTSPVVELEFPTPSPGKDQVLVRVLWGTLSPVDLWHVDFRLIVNEYPYVLGQALAGEVVSVGEGVTDFAVGDKVVSFTTFKSSTVGRAFQEYALIEKHLLGKVPSNISVEDGATIPDAVITVFNSYFGDLALPQPESYPVQTPPPDSNAPFLVWGAGGGVGQFAVQVLRILGYNNVIAVASSRHHEYLRSLGATSTVDYKSSDVVEQILKVAGGPVKYAYDTIADEEGSLKPISKVVAAGSKVAYLAPVRVGPLGGVHSVKPEPSFRFPDGVEVKAVKTAFYEQVPRAAEWQPKTIPTLVSSGLLKPIRHRVVPGTTLFERVTTALDILRKGDVSGERLLIQATA